MILPIPADYAELLTAVKARIRTAQYEALRAVNEELIALYWDIGAIIAERQEGKAPSIGIILCKEKECVIVEYALRETNKPMGVATYRMASSLPDDLAGLLPTPEQIARLLEAAV